jgi:uncharacterized protein YndB with AHSA1/START domain
MFMDMPSVTHHTFVIERDFLAPPRKVFAAFADPAKKRRWMGGEDEGFQIESFEMDFRVTKFERWRFRFQGGPIIATDVCYQDIIPDRRIIFVYAMSLDGKGLSSSQTTVEFLATEKGTTLVFTEQGAYFDGPESAKGREEGTRGLLQHLEREVQNG